MNVDGVDHVAAAQISDRDAPFHSAQEAAIPRVECARTPCGTGTPACLYASWITSVIQWDSLALDSGLPKHSRLKHTKSWSVFLRAGLGRAAPQPVSLM